MKKLILIILVSISLNLSAQQLSRSERQIWNGFIEYLEAKNLRGSTKLDNHNISKQQFEAYCNANGLSLDYATYVKRVQAEISAYRLKALNQIRTGRAVFDGTDAEFMPGLSVVDGWAGSKTTNYKFPSDSVEILNSKGIKVGIKPNTTY